MGKVAFIFPGQGSQFVGMGEQVAKETEEGARVFAEADEALGIPLSKLCFSGPEEELRLTANTQPALLATSIAILEVLKKRANIVPDFVAGHSLGEYSALVAAGAISFADAITMVRARGEFMEQAVPAGRGAMAAILGMERNVLHEVCELITEQGNVVQLANLNCPGQIVISGSAEGVERAGEKARQLGAKRVIPLNVSGPFHSILMEPAAVKLAERLNEVTLKDASIPVVANVTAASVQQREEIGRLLVEQVSSPVLWEDSVRFMIDQGVDTFVEIGAGKVLCGLVKKVDRNVQTFAIQDLESMEQYLSLFDGS